MWHQSLGHSDSRSSDDDESIDAVIQYYSVPAKPWTNVVSDDALVSELICLYFIWDGSVRSDFIEKTHFLEDMKTPPEDHRESRFCSPFLVNAMLALACVIPHPTTDWFLADFWAIDSKTLIEKKFTRNRMSFDRVVGNSSMRRSIYGNKPVRNHLPFQLSKLYIYSFFLNARRETTTGPFPTLMRRVSYARK